jgi:hypothetical protein
MNPKSMIMISAPGIGVPVSSPTTTISRPDVSGGSSSGIGNASRSLAIEGGSRDTGGGPRRRARRRRKHRRRRDDRFGERDGPRTLGGAGVGQKPHADDQEKSDRRQQFPNVVVAS